jgi:hypothetical protein
VEHTASRRPCGLHASAFGTPVSADVQAEFVHVLVCSCFGELQRIAGSEPTGGVEGKQLAVQATAALSSTDSALARDDGGAVGELPGCVFFRYTDT